MTSLFASWQIWAVLAAVFAALTAIFAKIGVENVGSDFATFVRTVVILAALALILTATGGWQSLKTVAPRSALFLALSGGATAIASMPPLPGTHAASFGSAHRFGTATVGSGPG